MCEIRSVKKGDLQAVADIMFATLNNFFDGDVRKYAEEIVDLSLKVSCENEDVYYDGRHFMYVATEHNEVIGLIHFATKYPRQVRITPLAVLKKCQRTGVSYELLKKMDEFAAANFCENAYCTVASKNQEALNFFSAIGYIASGKVPMFRKKGINKIILYKTYTHSPTASVTDFANFIPA